MRPNLEAIRQREQAATKGPWCYTRKDCKHFMNSDFIDRDGDAQGVGLCAFDLNQDNAELYGTDDDGHFIAAARSDIPVLLDYVAELESEAAVQSVERGRLEWHIKSLETELESYRADARKRADRGGILPETVHFKTPMDEDSIPVGKEGSKSDE